MLSPPRAHLLTNSGRASDLSTGLVTQQAIMITSMRSTLLSPLAALRPPLFEPKLTSANSHDRCRCRTAHIRIRIRIRVYPPPTSHLRLTMHDAQRQGANRDVRVIASVFELSITELRIDIVGSKVGGRERNLLYGGHELS